MAKYRSYKFTNKHHSKGGVRSSIAAAAAFVCTVIDVYGAYTAKGNAGAYLVIFGVAALIGSVYGTFTGYFSFREEECYYLFSKIGTAVSFLLLIFWLGVFGMGSVI